MELEKEEYGSEAYDDAYMSGGWNNMYGVHYSESNYMGVWQYIVDYLKSNDVMEAYSILEVGCGVGQLAQFLSDSGLLKYTGFDFSDVGIKKAIERNINNFRFIVDDVYTTRLFSDCDRCEYNLILITEVLEHLKNDMGILARIPKGMKIIGTVPNYDSKTRVRYFKSIDEIKSRYGGELNFERIEAFNLDETNIIFTFIATKK